ncbi:general stress protein [Jatrophihabitans sp. DSM 45814]
MTALATIPRTELDLDYPMALGTYDDYAQAQRVVDYLSDNDFPVQNVSIIGTELKSVERVTGRLTRGKLAAAGALSGLWMGLFVGIAFALFSRQGQLGFLITTPLLGALFGLIWSQIGFSAATRRGARDFSSISQVVATKYEIMVEHRLAAQAQQVLATMPGARSAAIAESWSS